MKLSAKICLLVAMCLFVVNVGTDFTAKASSSAKLSKGLEDFKLLKYGMFVHYLSSNANDTDEVANSFNPQKFANDLESWNVQYVIFTAWHYGMHALYPSTVIQNYITNWTSKRDLVGEVIKAVKAKGIKVILYTNIGQGAAFPQEAQMKTGWNNAPWNPNPATSDFDYEKWNNFICEVYDEMITKYALPNRNNGGAIIDGIYIDENDFYAKSDQYLDYPRIRKTIKQKNDNLVILHNDFGNIYSADYASKEVNFNFGQFHMNDWVSNNTHYGAMMTENWIPTKPIGTNAQLLSPEGMYRFTVLNASMNTTGGGVAWAAGPYKNVVWETGVAEAMKKLGDYVNLYKEALYNTVPSKAYITPPNSSVNTLKSVLNAKGNYWGVATDSVDGKYVYLHVLSRQMYNSLQISNPANNVQFEKAELLNKKVVSMEKLENGYKLTLPDGETWSDLDTIIKLTVKSKVSSNNNQASSKKTTVTSKTDAYSNVSSELLLSSNQSLSDVNTISDSDDSSETSNQSSISNIPVDGEKNKSPIKPIVMIVISIVSLGAVFLVIKIKKRKIKQT